MSPWPLNVSAKERVPSAIGPRPPEHVARAVGVHGAAEDEEIVRQAVDEAEPVNPAALAYINRLSDYLFVLARAVNAAGTGDVLWKPGAGR